MLFTEGTAEEEKERTKRKWKEEEGNVCHCFEYGKVVIKIMLKASNR